MSFSVVRNPTAISQGLRGDGEEKGDKGDGGDGEDKEDGGKKHRATNDQLLVTNITELLSNNHNYF
ncbi:MAG: hypothetical protein F6K47_16580 [Symploca sp. SIO2E6]|nr:hypothetical protein [Symploca sp. SIO2E6]